MAKTKTVQEMTNDEVILHLEVCQGELSCASAKLAEAMEEVKRRMDGRKVRGARQKPEAAKKVTAGKVPKRVKPEAEQKEIDIVDIV